MVLLQDKNIGEKMKKIGLVLAFAALLLLGVGNVNATQEKTHIWTDITNTGGYTKYAEQTMVGGLDWSEGAQTTDPSDYAYPPTPRMTAYISEGFENDGAVQMTKGVNTPRPWELEEYKMIQGTGNTKIWKHVEAWTEDKKIGCDGKLVYPTEAWVEVDFVTPKPFWDAESWYVKMDEPDAHDDAVPTTNPQTATFDKFIKTNEDFVFQQKVGINNFPSNYQIPELPRIPRFHWILN